MKYFWPYRFDEVSGELWLKGQYVSVPPKATSLLRLLLAEAGRPVSAEDILSHVWQGTHVQPGNVKALVHELRTVLRDSASVPRFIRSSHGRGYVFIADVTDSPVPFGAEDDTSGAERPLLPGRDAMLTAALGAVEAAREGATRVVLVEGERGVGKTSFCRCIAVEARRRGPVRVSRVQAVTGLGQPEPYGLLADAVGQLARQYPRDGIAVADRPPSPTGAADSQFRSLVSSLTSLSAATPCLIVIEDLQWADSATIDAVRRLVRSATPTGTCLVLSFSRDDGPRRDELASLLDEVAYDPSSQVHRLDVLSESDLRGYLESCFGTHAANRLFRPLFQASGGHPHALFVALDTLMALGAVARSDDGWLVGDGSDVSALLAAAAADVWRYYLRHIDSSRRTLLEAAATVGLEFTANDVAGITRVDQRLTSLQLAREADRRTCVEKLDHSFRFTSPVIADVLLAAMSIRHDIGLYVPSTTSTFSSLRPVQCSAG
jgi:DNA-binding winged helix-turn-helix (wHTH) protein